MEKIKRLLKALSPSEVRLLKQYLTAFHQKRKNKSLQLIELIEKNPHITEEELLYTLYGKINRKAFQMLRSRTTEKILQVVILTTIMQGVESSNEELLVYAILLQQRNLPDIAAEYLHKCLKKVEKEGLTELALLVLIQMKALPTLPSYPNNVNRKFKQVLAELETDVKGSELFDKWTRSTNQSLDKASIVDGLHLQRDLRKWEIQLSKAYTPRSHYYYLQTQVLFFQQKMNYHKSKETLEELFELVGSHQLLTSQPFLFRTYMLAITTALTFGQYELAALASTYAKKVSPSNPKALFGASKLHIYAELYRGKIESAQTELNIIKKSSHSNPYRDIVHYLQACIYFHTCKYKKASQEILQIKGLGANQPHFIANMRLFEFILLSEAEEYDTFLDRLESYRKFIQRYHVTVRHKLMYQCFNIFAKNLFYFERHSSKLSKILDEIQHSTKWDPLSYEVIRIDSWFKSKLDNKTFSSIYLPDLSKNYVENLYIPEPDRISL